MTGLYLAVLGILVAITPGNRLGGGSLAEKGERRLDAILSDYGA